MTRSVGCWRLRRIGLAIAMIRLDGCATGGSEEAAASARPPVVECEAKFLKRAAEELDLLPPSSATAALLGDYAVMREQAQACRSE